MTKKPKIKITTLDAVRLEKMMASLDNSQFPGKDELQDELDRADIVEPQAMPANIVTMNSTVKFQVESSDKAFSLTLVYPRDVDGSNEKISILAPVGSALLGLREGDQMVWPKPGGGSLQVRVLEVTYQPERSNDLNL